MDEEELKTLQERAEFFGLDNTKNLEDFRKKHLKELENLPKSGIIGSGKHTLGIGFQFFANKGILKQKDNQLEKSINSWKEHIELHKKIANPEQYDAGWNDKTARHQAGLLKHWQHEIDTSTANIKEAQDELERRKGT